MTIETLKKSTSNTKSTSTRECLNSDGLLFVCFNKTKDLQKDFKNQPKVDQKLNEKKNLFVTLFSCKTGEFSPKISFAATLVKAGTPPIAAYS
jgi:uncharacterized pyridoxamine 5'-phosphate oxidase family protein